MAAPNEVENLELDVYDDHLRGQDKLTKKKKTGGGEDGGDGAAAEDEEIDDDEEDDDAYLHSDNETEDAAVPHVPGPRALRGSTRLATLIDIKFELIAPFGELRPQIHNLDEDRLWTDPALLYLATGEGEETLKPGRKVEAKVRYVGENMVRVSIPELNNVEAVINADSVSSTRTQEVDCRNHFRNNDTVIAVIMAIDPEKRTLTLSTASKNVGDDVRWEQMYLTNKKLGGDRDYRVPTQKEINEEKMLGRGGPRKAKGPRVIRRAIKHPLFQNIQMADAASALLEMTVPVGSAMVRPGKSSRGLYLTMRQPGDKIWHIAITEKGKPTADLRLATPISVEPVPGQESEYDDLDEFSFRFVEPVAALLRQLVTHRKWRGGDASLQQAPVSWDEIRHILNNERRQHPMAAAYALAADEQRPGAFYLAYNISNTPRREFFVVLPEGFYFRKKVFKDLERMIGAFKMDPRANLANAKQEEEGRERQIQEQEAQRLAAQQALQQQQQIYQQQQYQQMQGYAGGVAANQYPPEYYLAGGGGYIGATVADPYAQEQQQYQQYQQQQQDPYSQGGWR